MWIFVGAICATAVIARWVSARRRSKPGVYWWSFSITFVMIIAGSVLLADQLAIDSFTGISNGAYFLSNVAFVLAGGSVQIYVSTLRRLAPATWRSLRPHVVTCAVVVGIVMVGWAAAPVHDEQWSSFRFAPITAESYLYDGVFHVYMVGVLANVSVCAWQLIGTTPAGDPSRAIGLRLVFVGGIVDVAAHLLYLVRMIAQPSIGDAALGAATAADVLTAVCLVLIVAGTATFIIGPRLDQFRRERELARALTPLWLDVRQKFPGVTLPVTGLPAGLRVERMIVEILDAVRHVSIHPCEDPDSAVIDALSRPSREGTSALSILLPTRTHDAEEALLLRLARAYETRNA